MSTNAADKMPATEAEASGVNKKMKLVITLEMEEPNPAVKKGVGEGDLETALATIETVIYQCVCSVEQTTDKSRLHPPPVPPTMILLPRREIQKTTMPTMPQSRTRTTKSSLPRTKTKTSPTLPSVTPEESPSKTSPSPSKPPKQSTCRPGSQPLKGTTSPCPSKASTATAQPKTTDPARSSTSSTTAR